MPAYEVRCKQRCFDNTLARRYWPGDVDKIDPMNPIAKYFEGWPAGVQVYEKVRGTVKEDPKEKIPTLEEATAPPPVAPVAPVAPVVPAPVAPGAPAPGAPAPGAPTPGAPAPAAPAPAAPAPAAPGEEMCPDCGKGPFKNMGAHKQHCSGGRE